MPTRQIEENVGEVERIRAVYADYDGAGRPRRWAEDRGIHAERRSHLATVLSTFPHPERLRVLDLGCGRGDLLAELTAAGIGAGEVVGIDLLPDRLTEARGRGLQALVGSASDLPFPDLSFDLVLAFTLFSSVTDPEVRRTIASEIGRVLRPDGAAVVYDLQLPNPANRALQRVGRRDLVALFPRWHQDATTLTLLPPLARRLAPEPGRRYRTLAAVPVLRSHRMTVLRPPLATRRATTIAGPTAKGGPDMGLAPLPDDASVTVVMPVRNEASFIDRSLGAVLDQVGVAPPQVIVVDGHSTDGTADRVREVATARSARITVVDNPARIVPVSMNLALDQATGAVIVRVDGHCVIAPDYLHRCLQALQATGAECVGGPMETVGETSAAAAIAAAQSSRFGVGGVAFRTSEEAAFVDTLAFGAYRREVFDHIGGFDEELVRNQDDELNLRLTRAGGRIWMDPSIRSTYFSRGTLTGLWRQYHGYGFYKLRVMRKHRTVPSPRHLVPAGFVAAVAGSVALSALRRSPWPAVVVLGPYLTGVSVSSASAAQRTATSPATVAAATTIMHTAYGLGWWAGAVRELGPGRR